MKKLILLFTMAMFIGFTANETFAQKKENKVVCFKSNMDCADCEKTVTEYLKFEKGVKDLKIDFVSNTIFVEYKDGKNTDDELAAAIEKKGYKAVKITQKEYEEIVAKTKKDK
ncbi:heavy-metal-associated domain-containing protein [uncultured Draconibacterium sp.]|uniref:heavy-metal-associated domain-containing protein n=1 Tax=uncultured Draconibacterium sp. TaxID=1573823 RepID=UPI0029C6B7E5|nr:heavy-metal-associated domain-containing protein [uncultured Draconibacterium sp.]